MPAVPSWADQDEMLRSLWQEGKQPEEIAEKLGRSVAAVMTRAARLGLPRRFAPGRKPSQKRAEGEVTQPGMARRYTTPAAEAKPAEPMVERVCLMCLTKFPSAGRHNRICNSCKDSNDYAAGNRLPDLDFPE
ncbi:MAG: hypothetical protein GC131_06910 [Alphaproteobacteria bacterium]|nr:hypothetical protein [Alphaproteobacteria bacterium]